jgi:hypothetical protein
VVAPKSQPTELKVAFGAIIIYGATNVSSKVEGFVPIQTLAPTEAKTHSSGATNLRLPNIIIKDKHMTSMVGTGMEAEALILVQMKSTFILVATTPSFMLH